MFQKNIRKANRWLHKTFSQKNVNRVAGYAHKKLDELKTNYNRLKQGLEESETGASDLATGIEKGTEKDKPPQLTDEQSMFVGAT